ncbi:MAG: ApaG domain [Holosporales bacterium]|jgi:ApaG protein|nr:ApaG domain [Holosporales bacterium]
MPYELAPVLEVSTKTIFLPHRSASDEEPYTWAEESYVQNRGLVTVQLRTRYRRIIDESGHCTEVEDRSYGAEGPVLAPGQGVSISERFQVEAASGVLLHRYEVSTERGDVFTVQTPAFSFDSPLPRQTH